MFFDKHFPRLIMMLEWSMTIEFDSTIIMNLVKTICSIITINCTMILDDFCEHGVVISLISKDYFNSLKFKYMMKLISLM